MPNRRIIDRKLSFEFARDLEQPICHFFSYGIFAKRRLVTSSHPAAILPPSGALVFSMINTTL